VEVGTEILVALIVGGIAGGVSSWLALRIRFERFQSKDDEREEARKEWRANVEKRLDSHARELRKLATHEIRISEVQQEVGKLRDRWHDFRDNEIQRVYEIVKGKFEK
jgi:adenylyl- and sulfurtransferase ThiI